MAKHFLGNTIKHYVLYYMPSKNMKAFTGAAWIGEADLMIKVQSSGKYHHGIKDTASGRIRCRPLTTFTQTCVHALIIQVILNIDLVDCTQLIRNMIMIVVAFLSKSCCKSRPRSVLWMKRKWNRMIYVLTQ